MKKVFFLVAALWLTAACQGSPTPQEPHQFRDISLVGYWHREPHSWDAARFAPHVSWKAPDGSEHWLFEAFLAITGMQERYMLNFGFWAVP